MGVVPDKAKLRRAASRVGAVLSHGAVVPTRRGAKITGVGLAALAVLGGTAQVTVVQASALPDDAAFSIGDDVTTTQELGRRVDLLTAFYGVTRPDDAKKQDTFTRDTAKAVVVSDILSSAAERRGIEIGDKMASDQLDKFIEQSFPNGKQDFVDKLGQLGLSQHDVLAEIKRQQTNATLYAQVTKDVRPVGDERLRDAFDNRRAEMVSPERRHLRNIVVKSEQEAKSVAKEAKSGADFARLAREHSLDASTKQQSGDLGTVAEGQLDKTYSHAAFGADANSVFGPVRSQYGWNVGQVVEITPAKPLSFDKVKKDLRDKLLSEQKSKVWSDWLAEQIKSADVEYAEKFRPADPSAPPAITR